MSRDKSHEHIYLLTVNCIRCGRLASWNGIVWSHPRFLSNPNRTSAVVTSFDGPVLRMQLPRHGEGLRHAAMQIGASGDGRFKM